MLDFSLEDLDALDAGLDKAASPNVHVSSPAASQPGAFGLPVPQAKPGASDVPGAGGPLDFTDDDLDALDAGLDRLAPPQGYGAISSQRSPMPDVSGRAVLDQGLAPERDDSSWLGRRVEDAKVAGKVIGQGLYSAAADVLPKTAAEVLRGGDVPLHPEETVTGRVIAEQQKDLERWNLAPHEADRDLFGVLKAKDVQGGLQNLGYSAGSIVAGMLGGAAAGSVVPGAGTATGAVAGAVSAGLAGGAVGYRATKDQFIEDMRQRMLQADPNLTEAKWSEAKGVLDHDASLYGMWEAVPEAVGSALTMGIIKTPVGSIIKSVPFIKNGIARALASAGVKLGMDLPVEFGTETWTQHEQGAIEARLGQRDQAPTWGEAFNEIAPQTTVMTLATMGLGHAADRVMPGARAARRDIKTIIDSVKAGEHAQLSDEDLARTREMTSGLFKEHPSIGLRDALAGLDAESARRQESDEQAAGDMGGVVPIAPASGPVETTPDAAPADQPDRAAELAKLSNRQLNDLASGLGIGTPGRIKRDALVASVLQAEEAARKWNEPDAVEARYQEAHAAPFPGQMDGFLDGAAPTGRRPRSRVVKPAEAERMPAVLPTGEVPLVEAGAEPAARPTSRPAFVEQTPEGTLPTGEVPLVEAGAERPGVVNETAVSAPKEEAPLNEPVNSLNETPQAAQPAEDLAAKSRRELNELAASLGVERPGAVRRQDLLGRIEQGRQEQAAKPQPEAATAEQGEAAQTAKVWSGDTLKEVPVIEHEGVKTINVSGEGMPPEYAVIRNLPGSDEHQITQYSGKTPAEAVAASERPLGPPHPMDAATRGQALQTVTAEQQNALGKALGLKPGRKSRLGFLEAISDTPELKLRAVYDAVIGEAGRPTEAGRPEGMAASEAQGGVRDQMIVPSGEAGAVVEPTAQATPEEEVRDEPETEAMQKPATAHGETPGGEAGGAPETAGAPGEGAKPEIAMKFGKEIGGSRYDRAQSRLTISDLTDMTEREREAYVVKNNVWPAMQYDKMIEDGVSRLVAYLVKKIRDAIPAAPQKLRGKTTAEAQEIYIRAVERARDVLSGVKTEEDLKGLFDKVFTAHEFDRAKPSLERWSQDGREMATALGGNKFVRAVQVTGRDLSNAFRKMTSTDWPAKRKRDSAGEEVGRPQPYKRPLLESVERTGEDYRQGKDVTPESFQEVFGFRGGEFGKWLSQTDRQESLNHAYDALMDLSGTLGVPPKALSLNGELGFAFGARGGGRFAAHYEPVKVVINLTKTQGAGALAHEWFHAMDDYFGRQSGDRGKARPYVSHGGLERWNPVTKQYESSSAMRPEMVKAWGDVIFALERLEGKRTDFSAKAGGLGKYWARPHEKAARAFEAYVQDQIEGGEKKSQYLVHGTRAEIPGVYPSGQEREAINDAFDNFFQTVKTKETGRGVAMFSRGDESRSPSSPVARAVAETLRQGLSQVPALRGIVDVYHAEADLPADLRREVEEAGVSGRFYGAYDPETKRILLMAGNIPTAKAAQSTFVQALLRHEGRHGGLDMMLGGRDARQEYMTRAAHAMPRQVSLWLERQGLDSTRATRAEAAEEILVSWAKDGTVHRVLDRLLAKMAEWVRSIFPSLKLTKAELCQILAAADDFVDGKGLDFVAPVGQSFAAAPAFARSEERASGGYSVDDATMPREARTFGEAKRSAREFVGQDLENDATGMVATVSNTNIAKMLSRSAVSKSVSPAAQAQAVANLNKLFRIAEDLQKHQDRSADPNFKEIHRFYALMVFDGEVLVAKLTVKEFSDPNEKTKIYSVESMEIEKAARIWEAAISPGQERITSPQAAFEVSARNREASISPEQERISSPQAEFIDKIRTLEAKVKGGEDSSPRFARAGELAGVPEEKEDITAWFKGEVTAHVRSFLPTLRGTLKETAVLGKILRSPEYWKHPVLKRLYEIFRDRTDQAHELLHAAFDLGDGRTLVEAAKDVFKNKRQREILNQGVDYADVNEVGPEAMEEWFREHGATEATVGLWRSMRDGYDMLLDARLQSYRTLLDKARDTYGRKIVRRLIEAGVPSKEAKTFDAAAYHADKTLSEDLAPYASEVAATVAKARRDGLTIKDQLADVRLAGEDGVSFSLRELIDRMGQMRGFYAPRLRETGDYVVRGQRTGEDGAVERFRAHKEWRAGAEALRAKMERAGWDMEAVATVEKLPEATQGIIKALELAKTVESAVNRVGEDVDAGLVRELLETLADEVKARGFRAQYIRRTGRHGDVVQGYFKDALERYTRYAGATAYGLAKMEAAGKAAKALFGQDDTAGIDIRKERDVYRLAVDYLSENLRNAEAGDRVFALAKSVASLKYLGLNPRSALVNLSSMATSVPAALHAYALEGKGGWARIGRETARAMADYLGVMTGKWGSFTADEKRFLEGIRKESLDDPQFARDALATYRDTAGKSWSWLMGKTLMLFGATEQLNRGSTLLAAYRLARQAGADHETAMARARETSDRAHGVYDRATQPAWTWGTSAGSRLGQSWYVYKKYGHNYLQLVHELFQKKDWQAATFALAAPMALGGLGSQVLMSIVKALFVAGGSDDDPEKWLYDFIRKNLGGESEELARFGLLGLLTGTDMSGSLGTMIDIPDTVTDVLGPMGGMARDVLAGIGFFAAGQPGRGAEKILPTGLSKILQAARESSQGVSTSKNFPVVGPDGKRLVPTTGESAAKAFGFRPAREAMARARTSEAIEEEKRWSEKRDRIYSRFRAFTLAGGTDAGERQSLVTAVADYNKGVADAGLSGRVSYITREALLRQTERLDRPTRREQARIDGGRARPVEAVTDDDVEGLSHPYNAVRRAYLDAKRQYDELREAGDMAGAARVRSDTRLPRLRMLVGRVQGVREEMGKVRNLHVPDAVKERRLELLRAREQREMDRAARTGAGFLAANGE